MTRPRLGGGGFPVLAVFSWDFILGRMTTYPCCTRDAVNQRRLLSRAWVFFLSGRRSRFSFYFLFSFSFLGGGYFGILESDRQRDGADVKRERPETNFASRSRSSHVSR